MTECVKGYVITTMELLCLASLKKMNKIYGFIFDESSSLKKNIHYALYTLARRKNVYLDEHSNKIIICQELNEIMEHLKVANSIFDIKNCINNERIILYKTKKNTVFLRQSPTKEGQLVIGVIPSNEIVDYLIEEGFIKDIIKNDVLDSEGEYENEIFGSVNEDRTLSIKKFNKECNIVGKIEIYETFIRNVTDDVDMLMSKENIERAL
ncbi:MAG: hypothetical protein E7262_07205 [Lachnospiraceae bacterium]|nr:hypothetical protein [Lachnospiraceae bacterium]